MEKKVTGVAEFRSFDDEWRVDDQINEWLGKYPHVTVLDVRYSITTYTDGDLLRFATFALVMYHEGEVPQQSRATTQRMQLPPNIRQK